MVCSYMSMCAGAVLDLSLDHFCFNFFAFDILPILRGSVKETPCFCTLWRARKKGKKILEIP